MATLSDIEVARRRKHRKKQLRKMGALALLLILVAVLYFNRQHLTVENISTTWQNFTASWQSGPGFPLELDGGVPRDIAAGSGSLNLITDTDIITYNRSGKQVKNTPHNLDDCAIQTSGSNSLLFGRGGKTFALYSKTAQIYQKTLEQTIIDGDVDSNGNVALATSSGRYLGEVVVYDRSKQQIYKWSSSDSYILSVDFGASGYLAVNTVNAQNGQMNTTVYVLNIKKDKEISKTTFENTMALRVQFYGSKVVVVGDRQITTLRRDGKKLGSYEYEGSVLSLPDLSQSDFCVAFGDNSQTHINQVLLFDDTCKVTGKIDYQEDILGVYAHSGRVAILSKQALRVFDKEGKMVKEEQIKKLCLDMSAEGNTVFVQTSDGLEKFSL
ncbi:DUF5711 family protein [Neobittarella massiliensis]|uniref:Uncharacterized protein n=2 Tax=Oscillospiraceae TaxID=216572 RepID=A0A8J6IR19_9FIRM|nr:DUF5711 family protein [Neobittarella massiliensis]MBC3517011.1 hypothetical protein [Neobittarella massiliensis]SCJ89419.1 Uncharacterised protein [uncultured Anaerotruncus sp.]